MTAVTDTARRLPRWAYPLDNRAARQTHGVRYRSVTGARRLAALAGIGKSGQQLAQEGIGDAPMPCPVEGSATAGPAAMQSHPDPPFRVLVASRDTTERQLRVSVRAPDPEATKSGWVRVGSAGAADPGPSRSRSCACR